MRVKSLIKHQDRLLLYRALHNVGDDDTKSIIEEELRKEFDAKTYNKIVKIFVKFTQREG